jgi:hypothetical protein
VKLSGITYLCEVYTRAQSVADVHNSTQSSATSGQPRKSKRVAQPGRKLALGEAGVQEGVHSGQGEVGKCFVPLRTLIAVEPVMSFVHIDFSCGP